MLSRPKLSNIVKRIWISLWLPDIPGSWLTDKGTLNWKDSWRKKFSLYCYVLTLIFSEGDVWDRGGSNIARSSRVLHSLLIHQKRERARKLWWITREFERIVLCGSGCDQPLQGRAGRDTKFGESESRLADAADLLLQYYRAQSIRVWKQWRNHWRPVKILCAAALIRRKKATAILLSVKLESTRANLDTDTCYIQLSFASEVILSPWKL